MTDLNSEKAILSQFDRINDKKKILTITGPSCAGKTTLAKALLATGDFCEIVSFTTRYPRDDEVDGFSYYFINRKEAQELIVAGKAIEYVEFNGNIYGTTYEEINTKLRSGETPLVVLEPHGLQQYQSILKDNLYSVYLDSTRQILMSRFLERFYGEVQRGMARGTKQDLLKYETKRILGMLHEIDHWKEECVWNMYIDSFTEENKESIVNSLLKLFKRTEPK